MVVLGDHLKVTIKGQPTLLNYLNKLTYYKKHAKSGVEEEFVPVSRTAV